MLPVVMLGGQTYSKKSTVEMARSIQYLSEPATSFVEFFQFIS